jgi:fibronectin type 3 domain-containing protein
VVIPTGLSYGNTGLIAGSSYSYRLRATDAAGNFSGYTGVASAITTGVDATVPTIPTNLTATPVSGTQINLTWTASTDNMAVTNYLIERCQGVGCVTFVQAATSTTPTYNDTGRTANTTYRYRIRATDAANKLSGYSTIQTAATSSGTVDCD